MTFARNFIFITNKIYGNDFQVPNHDGFVKNPFHPIFVIPAKAGIHGFL